MIYGMGTALTRFIGVLTLPLFTAYLAPEEYGVLAMLAVLMMIAQPIFGLGLSAAIGPCYFEGDSARAKLEAVWTAFALNFASGSVLMVVGWMWSKEIGGMVRLSPEYGDLVGLTLTGCAFNIFSTAFMLRVQFEKRAGLFVLTTVVTSLVAIAGSVVAVVVLGWGLRGMVLGQLTGSAATFLAFLGLGVGEGRPRIKIHMVGALVKQGVPMIFSFAFLFFLMHSNRYLLEWNEGLSAVGIYSVGFNLGMAISTVTSGVATAWYPFFMTYMERQVEARIIFGRVLTYYVYGVGTLALFFFLLAKPMVMLLTQPLYGGAYVVVGLIALANFIQALTNFFLPSMYFNKEVRYLSLLQGVAAILSVPVNYVLIAQMGILGAALGVAGGNLILALTMYCWNYINRSRYLLVEYEWRRVGIFLVSGCALLLIYEFLPGGAVMGELGKSAVFCSASVLMVFFLLRKSERSYALGILGGIVSSRVRRGRQ